MPQALETFRTPFANHGGPNPIPACSPFPACTVAHRNKKLGGILVVLDAVSKFGCVPRKPLCVMEEKPCRFVLRAVVWA